MYQGPVESQWASFVNKFNGSFNQNKNKSTLKNE